MTVHRSDLTPEEEERQRELDVSWAKAQRSLAAPEFRSHLEDALRRLDADPGPVVSRDDFLDQTRIAADE